MKDTILKDGKRLRLGYTTGSCAAAAAKAAAWMLLMGCRKESITLKTPGGITLDLPVKDIDMGTGYVSCAIEKDSGDDPDITNGMLVYARVSLQEVSRFECQKGFSQQAGKSGLACAGAERDFRQTSHKEQILLCAGEGIGRVTKPGLDQPVGEAAINSVPRNMILENVREVCRAADFRGTLQVTIYAPQGEALAKKTFNPRLGIVGGISILGTTGIVEPMSEDAIVETIRIELRQRRKQGEDYALLTPGNYGMDFIRDGMGLDPRRAVMVSNYIGDSLLICKELEYRGVLLVGHIGKLVKLAGGMMNTHSRYGDCRMEILAAHACAAGGDSELAKQILNCATCDDALHVIRAWEECHSIPVQELSPYGVDTAEGDKQNCLYPNVLERIQQRIAFMMEQKVLGEMTTGAIVFSRESGFLCETASARKLLSLVQT